MTYTERYVVVSDNQAWGRWEEKLTVGLWFFVKATQNEKI